MGGVGRTTFAEYLLCARHWLLRILYTTYSFRQPHKLSLIIPTLQQENLAHKAQDMIPRLKDPQAPFPLLPVPH